MKRIVCCVMLAMLLVCLAACSGYNGAMYDHLKNADNYQSCEVVIEDIYYIDPSTNEKKYDFADKAFVEYDIIFEVTFADDISQLYPFLGATPDESAQLEEYEFQFRVINSNSNILLEQHFFKQVTAGDRIRVRVSSFLYMDSEYFYIAQLEYAGQEYLNFEEGLKNIVDMMDKNKSPF